MFRFLSTVSFSAMVLGLSFSAFADDDNLRARAEVNHRAGQERSITMTEFWVPIIQDDKSVLYGDLRLMGDNADNREGNIGIGYRKITEFAGFKGVVGVHGWIDRRKTARGSTFHQATIGGEWLGEKLDILVNGYVPLSSERTINVPNANPQAPALVGTGIVVDTDGKIIEEPQHGFDIELGLELGQHFDFIRNNTDSFRIYGGGYYFDGDNTESVAGWRTRFTADINSDISVGARFQRDDERGSQGFLEATIRFPFGQKKSYRREGLRARLDDAPERDIDIITGEIVSDSGDRVQVLNQTTGAAQEVLHVDNTAAGGGDGSAESPFNTLAAAEGAASAQTIIYVNRGDGTTAGQNAGVTLDKEGQQLIGSGTNFIYDAGRFTTANGVSPTGTLIKAAGAAPIITNAAGDGIRITADNITLAGITVDGVSDDGVEISNADNVYIHDFSSLNATDEGIVATYSDDRSYKFNVIDTISDNNGNGGLYVTVLGTTQLDIDVNTNNFSNNFDEGLRINAQNTSIVAANIKNNIANNNIG